MVLLTAVAVVAITVFVNVVLVAYLAIHSRNHPGEVLTQEIKQKLVFDPYVSVIGQGLAYLVLIAAMIAVVRRRDQRPFLQSLRWNWPRSAWPTYLVGGLALAIAVQSALRFLPVPKSLPIQRFFETAEAAYLMTAFGILIAPLIEELFFRGFLYPVLARAFARAAFSVGTGPAAAAKLGIATSIVLTAGTFAIIHGAQLANSPAPLAMLFVVGVVITLARAVTGSVAAGLLIHVGYNTALFLLLYIGTDRFRHLERISQ